MDAAEGGGTYQVVAASLADLEAAQVVVAQQGSGAAAAQLHYITDDGQAAAEWFVVQECPQVGGGRCLGGPILQALFLIEVPACDVVMH